MASSMDGSSDSGGDRYPASPILPQRPSVRPGSNRGLHAAWPAPLWVRKPRADAPRSEPRKLCARRLLHTLAFGGKPCVPLPSPLVCPSHASSLVPLPLPGHTGAAVGQCRCRAAPASTPRARRTLYPALVTPCEAACLASRAKAPWEGEGDGRLQKMPRSCRGPIPCVPEALGVHLACDECLYQVRTGQ